VSRVNPVGGDLAGRWLSRFLTNYLAGERDLSAQTIASYRDAIRLLLTWFRDVGGTRPEKLRLADLNRARVLSFLDWLEAERGKGNWASQIDRNKKAGRGRPSKIAVVDPIIRALVQTADWSPDEPASKLADLVRQRLPDDIGGVNDDTVRKALDRIFTRTADRRFCGRSFLKRNRNWVKQP